ncbi:MAG TPA: hypothetical protein VGM87_21450 [Roseomonas sp.]|jgi:hypothetical protein
MSRFDPDLPRHLLDARHGLGAWPGTARPPGGAPGTGKGRQIAPRPFQDRVLTVGASVLDDDDLRIPPPPVRPWPRPRPPSALRCVMRDFTCGLLLAWVTVEVLLWFGGA